MVSNNTVGVVPTTLLDSLYPWQTFGPTLAAQLAQSIYGTQAGLMGDQIRAQASLAAAQADAASRTQSAAIGAQAQVDSQLIQTRGALRQVQAQIRGDLVRAAAGDINAAARLNGEFQLQAQLANNQNRLEVARLAGSGGLNDNIASRFFAHGMGAVPGMGSSFLAGGLQDVVAPNVTAMSIQDVLRHAPTISESGLGGGGGGNYMQMAQRSSGGGGGGFGNFQLPDMAGLFTQFNDLIGGLGGNVFGPAPSTTPGTPTVNPNTNPANPANRPANFNQPGGPTSTSIGANLNNGPLGSLSLQRTAQSIPNQSSQNAQSLNLAAYNNLRRDAGLAPVDTSDTGYRDWARRRNIPGFASGGIDQRGNYSARIVGEKGPEVEVETPFGTIIAPIRGQYAEGGFDFLNPFSNEQLNPLGIRRGGSGSYQGQNRRSMTWQQLSPGDENWARRVTSGLTPQNPFTPPAQTQQNTTEAGKGGGSTQIQTPDGTTVTTTQPGPLADMNNLPFLQSLRSGQQLESIYSLPQMGRPELGITEFPNPFQASSWYNFADSNSQQDYLDLLQALYGEAFSARVPRMIAAATPGRRLSRNPLSLSFA